MRKKIFIIHGKGVNKGIGRETGGDLDTIASNAFYAVWAQNSLKEELGRDPVYGQDYDFDFINYSEGINHLAAHSGCDIYIPDFPIDALSPRLKLLRITDESSIKLFNKFTSELDVFKLWIIKNADIVSDAYKDMFNLLYKQVAKILEHQAAPVLQTANDILIITKTITELSVLIKSIEQEELRLELDEQVHQVMTNLVGDNFYIAKKNILAAMKTDAKYEMSELVEKKEEILAFDKAYSLDLSTQGRINYTDEFIILIVETIAYLVRGYQQLRELPFDENHRETMEKIYSKITKELYGLYSTLSKRFINIRDVSQVIRDKLDIYKKNIESTLSIIDGLQNYSEGGASKDNSITVLLTEDATGKAVQGVEIVFYRLQGKGVITDKNGNKIGDDKAIVETDEYGSAKIIYKSEHEEEDYQFNVTFDDLHVMLIPDITVIKDDSASINFDEEEEAEETIDKEEKEKTTRSERISLLLIERMFKYLKENDVNIISLDDHHPYTPQVLKLLEKLRDDGYIGHVQIHAAPRGEEEAPENLRCGADLIYKDRIKGQPWDNSGLAHLRYLAHVQDLHIEFNPLGIELSKLIGSGYNKIDMVLGLAKIKDKKIMQNIMKETGWDKNVAEYEAGLSKVLPRTETNIAHLNFIRKRDDNNYSKNLNFFDSLFAKMKAPKDEKEKVVYYKKLYFKNKKNRVQIIAALSPFTDPKKGETKINVASAIGYLLGKKKYYADYFFYCYGGNIMTTRKPNDQDETINLSTMAQFIGTKADGGHKGAATCQPISNPNFPKKRIPAVKEKNLFEYFNYLGGKVADYSGTIEFLNAEPLHVERYTEGEEKTLSKIPYNLIEYTFKKDGVDKEIKALLTMAPKVNRKQNEAKPSITQVIERTAFLYNPDYIFFLQGGMASVVLYNVKNFTDELDLELLAKHIGWDEDGGNRRIAIATPKRNRSIPKDYRWVREDDFFILANMFVNFINNSNSEWKITDIQPVSVNSFTESYDRTIRKYKSSVFELILKKGSEAEKEMPSKFSIAGVMAPFINKSKNEEDISFTVLTDIIKKEKYDYMIFISYKKIIFVNLNDKGHYIDLGDFVRILSGGEIVNGLKDLAVLSPTEIKNLPGRFEKINFKNLADFLKYIGEKIGAKYEYDVKEVKKKQS